MKSIFYPFWRKKRKKKSYKPTANSQIYSLSKQVNDLREEYYEANEKIRELAKASHLRWEEGFVPDIKEWKKDK